MKPILIFAFSLLIVGCKKETKTNSPIAEDILSNVYKVSGSEKVSNAIIAFQFREINYKAKRNKGQFELERYFVDSTESNVYKIRDVLTNKGFQRFSNEKELELSRTDKSRFSASVNSVHYFSVLPYGLKDKAVFKTIKDSMNIRGKSYHTIEITFDRDGGGEDYDDVFLYWINKETYKVDYLAYSYSEPKGRGLRFREAYNERYIEAIRFVDYNNYKPKNESVELLELPELFKNEQLELLSKIELENVTVN